MSPAYIKQNLVKCLPAVKSDSATNTELAVIQAAFEKDFDHARLAWSEAAFNAAITLFQAKWSDPKYGPMFTKFLNKLKDWWLQPVRSKWYKGAAVGYVMNNGGLESQNKYFKLDATKYEKMNTHELVTDAAPKWVTARSERYKDGAADQVVPQFDYPDKTITDSEWKAACAYSRTNPVFLKVAGVTDTQCEYMALSGECTSTRGELTTGNAPQYYELYNSPHLWTDYSQYVSVLHGVHIISRCDSKWSCTCPKYMLELFCKHIIHIRVTIKDNVVYDEKHRVTILAKRGPDSGKTQGRPPKAVRYRELMTSKNNFSLTSTPPAVAPGEDLAADSVADDTEDVAQPGN